jgi:CBS domain containing-hemolysin-like protein
MTPVLWILAAALTLLLGPICVVQLLYLESLRLRTRELPALELFKDTLEDRLGLTPERGVLTFSLVKHSAMVMLGLVFSGITLRGGPPAWWPLAEAAASAVAVMVLSAYIVPQLLYRKTSGRWLLSLAPAFKALAMVIRPLTSFFEFLQSLAALSEPPEEAEENGSPQEELDALIEAGADEGLIEEGDRKLIRSVVALGDKAVREVMTPRPNVLAIQQDASMEDLLRLAIDNHFSRIPVYADSIDSIVGFVHLRDMLTLEQDDRASRKVKEFTRPIRFVPETKPADDLFREMQQDSVHMAIVVDEYGDTAGLATMEDVVEEVFGEIRDEYDPTAGVQQDGEGAYIVSGNVDLDHLHEMLGFRPDEGTESTTVGGLVTEWLGHVPEAGEVVERDGIRIEVTAGDERHVQQVRVCKSAPVEMEQDGEH